MKEGFTIRRARPSDLGAIRHIVDEGYAPYVERVGRRPAPMDDDYEALIIAGAVHVAARRVPGDGALDERDAHDAFDAEGGASHSDVLGLISMHDGGDHWMIDNVATSVLSRGQGIGTALLERANDLARQSGRSVVRLFTHESMIENIGHYLRAGFEETNRVTERGFDRVYFERSVGPARDDLRAYYDEEARRETRNEPSGRRIEIRAQFITQLHAEGRTSVIDFGSGPGSDGSGFSNAGLNYVGLDLAHANAGLARTRGVAVVHGSVLDPPIRPAAFDAGWSVSVLMHLEPARMEAAASAMCATLKPGSPMVIGVWGGELGSQVDESRFAGQRRPFELRSLDHNVELLESAGTIENTQRWESDVANWEYQVIQLRTPT